MGSIKGSNSNAVAGPRAVVKNGLLRAFVSLRYRNFRLLWFGQVCQAATMWTEQVVRNWLTLELTGSALQLGTVNLVRVVPSIMFGLWGGVLADRIDRKKLLLVSQAWSALIFGIMMWVVLSGNLQLWHLYGSAIALGLGQSANQPVRTSLIPLILPKQFLLNALTLNSIAINLTRLVLPAVVGIGVALYSPGWAYTLCLLFYIAMFCFTLFIQVQNLPRNEQRGSMIHDFTEALKFVFHDRLLLALLILPAGPLAFAFSFQTLLPVYATRSLDMGVGTYGILMSAGGVGALIAGMALISRTQVLRQGQLQILAGVSYGLALFALAITSWIYIALLVMFCAAASQAVFRATNNSLLLGTAPAELRGRIMGLVGLVQGLVPVSAVLGGWIADTFGISLAMATLGGVCLLIVVSVTLWEPRTRTL